MSIKRVSSVEDGFTILEILVSIALAGIFILAFSVLTVNLNVINDKTSDLTIANSFIENKVEQLRSESFLGLSNGSIDFTAEMPQTLAEPRSASYTVADVSGNAALKDVTFVISYEDHGQSRTINYATFIGELGVGQY